VRLDTHLHLWDPAVGVYSWLKPGHGPLYAAFGPDDARAELEAAGVDAAVLVQAADSTVDTERMLAVADTHAWVAGVVGWVDLEKPDRARAELERLGDHPAFCGVRQLVHDDPRPDVLGLPAVRATLRLLVSRGVPFDVPDAFPRHLEAATRVAAEVDDLVVVLDHLAKPPRGTGRFGEWERQIRAAARHGNVVAKLSGLAVPGAPWTLDSLQPVWDVVLDAFGPTRLMYGSDWPVTVAGAGYSGTASLLGELVAQLSPSEQDDVWWRTGNRVYSLDLGGTARPT
jgi:L-fuconolactonase